MVRTILSVLILASFVTDPELHAQQQTVPVQTQSSVQQTHPAPKYKGRSAGGDIGSGTGDIGKGAGKGVGSAAGGAGEGAVDVATLHPVKGAEDVGKGGVVAGKDVGVGAAKGTGKIVKGTGKAVKKVF